MGSLLTPGLQLKQPFEMEEVSRVVGKLKRSQLALIDFEATQKKLNQIAFSFISFTAGGGYLVLLLPSFSRFMRHKFR